MKTFNKYDVTFSHGFGMYTKVRVELTPEETTGIVKLMDASRDQGGGSVIKLISLVLEGEDDAE
jgi:hypothetical protein